MNRTEKRRMVPPLRFMALFAMIVLGFGISAVADASCGRLGFVSGDVFLASGNGGWRHAKPGATLAVNDRIKTGDFSRCEVSFANGSLVRLDESSSMKVLAGAEGEKIHVRLFEGLFWVNAQKKAESRDVVRIFSQGANFLIEGTCAGVDTRNGATIVSLYSQLTESDPNNDAAFVLSAPKRVTMEKWVEIVKSFRSVSVSGSGEIQTKELSSDDVKNDPWIQWNLYLDQGMRTDDYNRK